MCQMNLDQKVLAENALAALGRDAAIAHLEAEAKRHEEQGKGKHPMVADQCDMRSFAYAGAAMLLRTGQV